MNSQSIALQFPIRCTFGSILMAVVWSNFLLTVISFFLRSVYKVKASKYRILYIFPVLITLRCLLPIEFPSSRLIFLQEKFFGVYQFLRLPLFDCFGKTIDIGNLLMIICVAGTLVKAYGYFLPLLCGRRYIRKYTDEATKTEPYKTLMDQICKETGDKNKFRIFLSEHLTMPALQGIRNPYILMPVDLRLCEEDLYYILKYYAIHHFQYSYFLKSLLNMMEILFWWNPAVYLVKRQVFYLLDVQADEIVTGGEKRVVCDYLNSRMRVLRFACQKGETSNILDRSIAELDDRFRTMLHKSEERKMFPEYVVLGILVIATIIASYRFVLVPDSGMAENVTVQAETDFIYDLEKDGPRD